MGVWVSGNSYLDYDGNAPFRAIREEREKMADEREPMSEERYKYLCLIAAGFSDDALAMRDALAEVRRLRACIVSMSTDSPAWKDCPGCPMLGDSEAAAEPHPDTVDAGRYRALRGYLQTVGKVVRVTQTVAHKPTMFELQDGRGNCHGRRETLDALADALGEEARDD
jgi:hypothetical protein